MDYPYSWPFGKRGPPARPWYGQKSRRIAKRKRPSSYPVIRRPLRPELKFLDTPFAAVQLLLGSNAVMQPINLVAQGTTSSTRVGMKFIIQSVQLSLTVSMAQFIGTSNSVIARFILFVDTQCNGAVPTEIELLSQTDNVNSLMNPQHAHRFKKLMDKKVILNAPGLAWNGSAEVSSQMHVSCPFYKKLSTPIFYDTTTNVITGVTQNNLILFVYADTVTPTSFLNGSSRIRYTDL